jgi:hypothetical protein
VSSHTPTLADNCNSDTHGAGKEGMVKAVHVADKAESLPLLKACLPDATHSTGPHLSGVLSRQVPANQRRWVPGYRPWARECAHGPRVRPWLASAPMGPRVRPWARECAHGPRVRPWARECAHGPASAPMGPRVRPWARECAHGPRVRPWAHKCARYGTPVAWVSRAR